MLLIAVVIPVYSAPYLYFGLGARRWLGQVGRDPSTVTFDWGSKLASTAIGSPDQGLADARAEECADSQPSARTLYDQMHRAAEDSDAQGGWHLSVIPGDATVHRSGPVTATADVPATVRATVYNVTVTDRATGAVVGHAGQVGEKHQWTIHLRRTWSYPVWQVCGITVDKPLLNADH
ncbi:hypothetical protein [Cryptosporangium sp. NPDC051539]|uniref:hypothetical protein n=1 Tax=Cryptosporangium sp. NPDC051539 TaxID=3363962 RepID=UPI0037A1316E